MARTVEIVALAIVFLAYFTASTQAKLKLLNVVFRHGDRAPDGDGIEIYPNDPYKNSDFYPMGFGGLSDKGKLREYELGQYLRKEYKELGDVYVPSDVTARSTSSDRAKMSLQLVLAGLYPPIEIQQWSEKLGKYWQPIVVSAVNRLADVLLRPEECPLYLQARKEVEHRPEVVAKLTALKPFMANLSAEIGKPVRNSNDLYFLYHALTAEKSLGLELPAWTKTIYPDGKLLDGTNLEYEIFSYNEKMKRLNGGTLVRKFIENMEAASKKKSDVPFVALYSGHETNVAALLQALGVFYPHVPEYSSAVIVELHEENKQHIVKVKYYKGIAKADEKKVQELLIPGCNINGENSCTLDLFKKALGKVIPSNDEIKCDKRSLRHLLETDNEIPYGIRQPILDAIIKEEQLGTGLF